MPLEAGRCRPYSSTKRAICRNLARQGRSSVVEQRPFKPKVVGSIPTAPTNISLILMKLEKSVGALGALLRGVFRRNLRKVVQRGLQRSPRFLRGRTIDHSRYDLKYAGEHLHAEVAVREQAGRVGKVVSPCHNLNRHGLSPQTVSISAVTKVTALRARVCKDLFACALAFLLASCQPVNSRKVDVECTPLSNSRSGS
jgi:hypothetical protein